MAYANPDASKVVANGDGWDVEPENDPTKDRDKIQFACDHVGAPQAVVLLKAGIHNLGTDAYNPAVPGNRKSVKITTDVKIKGEGAATVIRGGGDQTFDTDAAVGADSLADGLARAELSPNGLYHAGTFGLNNILAGAFVGLSAAKVTIEDMDFEQFLFAGLNVRRALGLDLLGCNFRDGVGQLNLVETGGIATGIWMGRISTSQLFSTGSVVDVPNAIAGDILVKECSSDSSHHMTSVLAGLTMLAMNAGIEIKECDLKGAMGGLSAEIFDTRDAAKTVKLLDNKLYGGVQLRAIEGDYEAADNIVDLRGLPGGGFGPFAVSHAVTGAGHEGLVRDNEIWSHLAGSTNCFVLTANGSFGLRSGGSKGIWIRDNQVSGLYKNVLNAPNRAASKPADGNFYWDNEHNVSLLTGGFHAKLGSQSLNNLIVGLDPDLSQDLGTDNVIVLDDNDLTDAEKALLDAAKAAATTASSAQNPFRGFGGMGV